jgi:hypothetical protein
MRSRYAQLRLQYCKKPASRFSIYHPSHKLAMIPASSRPRFCKKFPMPKDPGQKSAQTVSFDLQMPDDYFHFSEFLQVGTFAWTACIPE